MLNKREVTSLTSTQHGQWPKICQGQCLLYFDPRRTQDWANPKDIRPQLKIRGIEHTKDHDNKRLEVGLIQYY